MEEMRLAENSPKTVIWLVDGDSFGPGNTRETLFLTKNVKF